MIDFGTAQFTQLNNELNTLEDYLVIEPIQGYVCVANEDKPGKPRRSLSQDIRAHLVITTRKF
jgi:hypothetical protein